MNLQNKITSVQTWAQKPKGKRILNAIRIALFVLIISFLIYRIAEIGWLQVWQERPKTIWFYVVGIGIYFYLPAFETIIYKRLFNASSITLLPALIRKRVLNMDLFDYSGEVYFISWAKKRNLADKIIGPVKDNLIMSSVASNLGAVVMLTVLVGTGNVALSDLTGGGSIWLIIGGAFLIVLTSGVLIQLRKAIFSTSKKILRFLFTIHTLRFIAVSSLQILQWWVVLPDTPFPVWATVLAVYTVAHRLPFVPAKDLVSASLVVSIGANLDASTAAIASMLITRSAMEKILGVTFYGMLTTIKEPENEENSQNRNESDISN